MNKFFKNKFAKASVKTSEPRELADINKDYTQLCAQVGELESNIRIGKKRLEQVHASLEALVSEGNARAAINAEAQKEASKEGAK